MSATQIIPAPADVLPEDLPIGDLSENARIVLKRRYLKKDELGRPVEEPEHMFWRVARTIAEAEPDVGGLQEAYIWQVDWLVLQLPEYEQVGRGRDADGGGQVDRRRDAPVVIAGRIVQDLPDGPLRGAVLDEQSNLRAEDAASAIFGVESVDNRLRLKPARLRYTSSRPPFVHLGCPPPPDYSCRRAGPVMLCTYTSGARDFVRSV